MAGRESSSQPTCKRIKEDKFRRCWILPKKKVSSGGTSFPAPVPAKAATSGCARRGALGTHSPTVECPGLRRPSSAHTKFTRGSTAQGRAWIFALVRPPSQFCLFPQCASWADRLCYPPASCCERKDHPHYCDHNAAQPTKLTTSQPFLATLPRLAF